MHRTALSILTILLTGSVCASEPPRRLIWITIDTLRADHLHYMGYERETSPWLDEFALDSVDFRRAFSPSNVTGWSVSSFFTSKYCRDLVDTDPPLHIPRAETTVAELLRGGGFRTTAFIANVGLRPGLGFEQGFDEYHAIVPRSTPYASIDEVIHTVRASYSPTQEREFIYIHTMDVHAPWRPPIPFDAAFAPEYDGGGIKFGMAFDAYRRFVLSDFPYHSQVHSMDKKDTEMLVSQYDGSILYTDARLEALLESVSYNRDNDMIIITSDHGEAFFEHGYLSHGKNLFPEETHVPLLIRVPGIAPGRRDHAVSLHDLLPTITDVFDLETPADIVGTTLLPDLLGYTRPTRYVISEHSHRAIPAAIVVGDGYLYRMNGMSHYRYPWRLSPFMEGLYNLDSDPLCLTNLLYKLPDRAERFNRILRTQDSKFAPYTREALQVDEKAIALGPDLLPSVRDWHRGESGILRGRAGGVQINLASGHLLTGVRIREPGHAHLIEVEYRLSAGVLRLKLQNNTERVFRRLTAEEYIHHPDMVWDYPVRKPTSRFAKVRAVVYPWADRMFFIAAMEKPGSAELRSVRLRRLYVPELQGVPPVPPPPDPLHRTAPKGPKISEEWKNRLDALGYIN